MFIYKKGDTVKFLNRLQIRMIAQSQVLEVLKIGNVCQI